MQLISVILKVFSSTSLIDFLLMLPESFPVWVETIFFYRLCRLPTSKKYQTIFPTFHNFIPNIRRPSDHLSKNVLFMAWYWNGKQSTHFTQQGIQNEIKKILKFFAYQQLPFRQKPRSFERWEHPRSLRRCICQTCWFPLEILLHDSHLTLLSATMIRLNERKNKVKNLNL